MGYSGEISLEKIEAFNAQRPGGPAEKLCYSPFKNLYFGHKGKAIACCYNRNYVLGNYPEDNIKEIWFGKKAEALRGSINNNSLSLGCESCRNFIETDNHAMFKGLNYDEPPLNENKYPSVLEFELSNVCNLECVMCSGEFSHLIRQNRENLPPIPIPYDSQFVNQLAEFIPHLHTAKFYGGEPFLIDIYYEVWDKILELNPEVMISVQTNGTVLNNRVKTMMEKGTFHMNISLDSLDPENYPKIRINGKLDRVLENIKWFREYTQKKDTFFGISVCGLKKNWHELPNFVRFCNEIDAQLYIHSVFNPKSESIQSLPPEELEAVVDSLSAEKFETNSEKEAQNVSHFQSVVHLISTWSKEANAKALVTNRPLALTEFQAKRETLKQEIEKYYQDNGHVEKAQASLEKFDAIMDLIATFGITVNQGKEIFENPVYQIADSFLKEDIGSLKRMATQNLQPES